MKKKIIFVIAFSIFCLPQCVGAASLFTKAADFNKVQEYSLKYITYSVEEQSAKEGLKKLEKYDIVWDLLGKSEEYFLNGDPKAWPDAKDRILKIKLVFDQTQVIAQKLGSGNYDDVAMESVSLALGIVDHPVVNLLWAMCQLTYKSHKEVKSAVAASEIEQIYGIIDNDRFLHGAYSPDGPKLIPTDSATITYFYNKYIVTNRHTRNLVRTYVREVIGAELPEYSPSVWQRLSGTASIEKEDAELAQFTEARNQSRAWIRQLIGDVNKQVKFNWAQMTLRRQIVIFNEFKDRYDSLVKEFNSVEEFYKHWRYMKNEQKNYASIYAKLEARYNKNMEDFNYKHPKTGERTKIAQSRPIFWDIHKDALFLAARARTLEDYEYAGTFDKMASLAMGRILEVDKIKDEDISTGEKMTELIETLTSDKPTETILQSLPKYENNNPSLEDIKCQNIVNYYEEQSKMAKAELEEFLSRVQNILKTLHGRNGYFINIFERNSVPDYKNPVDTFANMLAENNYIGAGQLAESTDSNNPYSRLRESSRHKLKILEDGFRKLNDNRALISKTSEELEKIKFAQEEWQKLSMPSEESLDFAFSSEKYKGKNIQDFKNNIAKLNLLFQKFNYDSSIKKLNKLETNYIDNISSRQDDIAYFDSLREEIIDWFDYQTMFSFGNDGISVKNNPSYYAVRSEDIFPFYMLREGPYAGHFVLRTGDTITRFASKKDWSNANKVKKEWNNLQAKKFWKVIKKDLPETASLLKKAYEGKSFKTIEKPYLLYMPPQADASSVLLDEQTLNSLVSMVESLDVKDEQYKSKLLKINDILPKIIYFPSEESYKSKKYLDKNELKYLSVGSIWHIRQINDTYIGKNSITEKYRKFYDLLAHKFSEREKWFEEKIWLDYYRNKVNEERKEAEEKRQSAYKKKIEEEEDKIFKPASPSADNNAIIQAFYSKFTEAYEAKQDNRLLSYISDNWECGDGTTLQDLQDNFNNMFTIYDSLKYEISGLKALTTEKEGVYSINYKLKIIGRSFSLNIQREEQSSVSELLQINKDKPQIIKTLSGTYWYKN